MKILGPFFLAGLAFVGMGATAFADKKEDTKARPRQLEQELKKARQDLHEAHRELGERADRIHELEKRLKDADGGQQPEAKYDRERLRSQLIEIQDQLQDARRENRELEKKLSEANSEKKQPTKEAEGKNESKKPGGSGRSGSGERERVLLVAYEVRSAVNLVGRDEAVGFVSGWVRKKPSVRFRIEAGADDTDYATADRDIAQNRANFLMDYLGLHGVDREVISEVEAISTRGREGETRYVKISVIDS
jgi:hypothetical protein